MKECFISNVHSENRLSFTTSQKTVSVEWIRCVEIGMYLPPCPVPSLKLPVHMGAPYKIYINIHIRMSLYDHHFTIIIYDHLRLGVALKYHRKVQVCEFLELITVYQLYDALINLYYYTRSFRKVSDLVIYQEWESIQVNGDDIPFKVFFKVTLRNS